MKMNLTTPVILAACVLTLAGCSSTPKRVDTGPIAARSFSFVQIQGKPAPVYADNGQEIHALIQNAITQSLARRQVNRVDNGGDITVAYLIITGNNAVTTSIDEYFGYGGDDVGDLRDKAHKMYTGSKNPNYFEAGTLLIDLVDSKSWKLLKRGYATRALQHNVAPEVRSARIQEVVEQILADARFKQF